MLKSQQNISKLNSKIHQTDHTPWSTGFYSRDARTAQYPQINKYDASHKQNERQKSHNRINRYRKTT